MRFVVKAVFWLFVVSMFMPSEDVRASLPELNDRLASARAQQQQQAKQPNKSLCERSPETCEAIAESRILTDIAGAAVETGVRHMMARPPQAESPEDQAPDSAS